MSLLSLWSFIAFYSWYPRRRLLKAAGCVYLDDYDVDGYRVSCNFRGRQCVYYGEGDLMGPNM